MEKSKLVKKIFHSKVLVFFLIFSFFLLITSEATPYKIDSDSNKEFKPIVRVKEAGEEIPADQKDRFERLIEEGKKLFQEEMDPEGAMKKFKEARALAITRAQKADVYFYLSLVYYATIGGEAEELAESIRKLIEVDYYRELDKRLCPPRYRELFQGIKKEYGVLIVQSKPVGADVYLNDSKVPAGKTPLTIGSKAGSVKIVLKKGKKVKTHLLSVIAGKEVTTPIVILKGGSSLLLVLGGIALAGGGAVALLGGKKGNGGGNGGISGPTTGTIQVNSTPAGARVYLDGNNTGQTTNCTLTNLTPGSHDLELIKEGYVNHQESVPVTAGQTTTVNAPLTWHTITVTNPTGTTVWIIGDEVEIRWQTSGSASFKAYASPTTGLNPLSYPGRNLSPSFQRRAFRHNPAFRGLLRARRGLESNNLSKNEGPILNKSSKFQDIQKKSSSNGKVRNIINPRVKNIGIIEKNNSFSSINSPLSPGASFNSSRHFPQALEPSGNIKALTLTNVKIELYEGTNLVQTIAPSTGNDGSYMWTVDSTLTDGTNYKVRVSCAGAPEVYDESAQFEIDGEPAIVVTEPTSSTVWHRGDSADITWTWEGAIDYVKIQLYKETTMVKTIVNVYNDGSYTWSTVDTTLTDGTDYKVRVSDLYNSNVYGESAQFEIAPPSITVTEPTSSTVWSQDQSADITWTSKGAGSYVIIDLYKGTTWKQTINSFEYNDGSYTWIVDSTLTDGIDYRVRVSDYYDSNTYGDSAPFEIAAASITVTEPTSSTVWDKGQSVDITWTSTGTCSSVKIELYKGTTWEKTITSSTENDDSYTWTVDSTLTDGSDYKVKITCTANSSIYGESAYFTIGEPGITVDEPTSSTVWYRGASADITWTSKGASNYVKIELYKGSTREQTISSMEYNDGSYTWTVDTSLPDDTDYKVKILDYYDSNMYGESAQFEIAPASITVTEPTSSSVWHKNDSADINWTSEGASNYVIIDLYKGSTWVETITSMEYNDGSYTWSTVDTSLTDGTDYKVRISDYYDTNIYGESAQFEIAPPSITVTEPTSSTVWDKDQSADITWTSEGASSYVKIELYKGISMVRTIDSFEYNDGSYTWTVDSTLADDTDYKVKISDYYDSNVYGESAYFTIGRPGITVTGPTSSTVWSQGDSVDITWTSVGTISYVKIELYKGTSMVRTIDSYESNDGSYTWTVDPSLPDGSDYKVRISSTSDPAVYDESDTFTIEEKSITVTEPTGSTVWSQGYSADITWASTGAINNVKIDLYKGGTLNQSIVPSTVNDGSYTWSVEPSLEDSSDYKVRISSTSDPGIYDESQEFQISSEYEFVTKWGSSGSGDGQFNSPYGIAIDNSDYVYVADMSNNRIQKFTSAGTFETTWGSSGSEDGQFKSPLRVAVDNSGYVYVADYDNHRIQKFTSSGGFVTKWGSSGSGNGQFNTPTGIAVDSSSFVYVVDTGNNRIQKFTSNGSFITKWGSSGSGEGTFNLPLGIAVDNSGYVYVVEKNNHRIQKFTSSGGFVTKWGSAGSGEGQFLFPFDIAVDSSGGVYVADTYNNRIQKFQRISGAQGLIRNNSKLLYNNFSNNKNSMQKSYNIKSPLQNRLKNQKTRINKKDRKNEKK